MKFAFNENMHTDWHNTPNYIRFAYEKYEYLEIEKQRLIADYMTKIYKISDNMFERTIVYNGFFMEA